jgi:hypothetical protein
VEVKSLSGSVVVFAVVNQLWLAFIAFKSIQVFGTIGEPLGLRWFWLLILLNTGVLACMQITRTGGRNAQKTR